MTSPLERGTIAPWFECAALDGHPRYAFNTVAGRWTVMLLLGSAASDAGRNALDVLARHRDLFDDENACFFGVTVDPGDAGQRRIAQQLPGVRWFLDYDGAVSTAYQASRRIETGFSYTPHWLLLDHMQRVRSHAAIEDGERIMAELRRLRAEPPVSLRAPVLILPNVLPPELCRDLIDRYEREGGKESGFMRETDGFTSERIDHGHKRRSDLLIRDEALIGTLKARIFHTLRPMIQRAFQFEATRIERFIVACYDAENGGHFRPHRDNTTKATAHRRFACTVNLNAQDYEGGDLRFPEFGPDTYRAPTGGAVVFSCSLLHEALPVTRGRRYAFLPFFYDDAGARLRESNLPHVAPELRGYRATPPADMNEASAERSASR